MMEKKNSDKQSLDVLTYGAIIKSHPHKTSIPLIVIPQTNFPKL